MRLTSLMLNIIPFYVMGSMSNVKYNPLLQQGNNRFKSHLLHDNISLKTQSVSMRYLLFHVWITVISTFFLSCKKELVFLL